MPVITAKILNLHWDEKDTSIQEATLEVEYKNGDTQLFVIPILRMTDRIKNVNPNPEGHSPRTSNTDSKDSGRGED